MAQIAATQAPDGSPQDTSEQTQQATQPVEPPNLATPEADPPWLAPRLERAKASAKQAAELEFVKSNGFDTVDAFNEWKAGADKATKAQKEAERAQMTELEQARAALADEQGKTAKAVEAQKAIEAKMTRIEAEAKTTSLCAQHGIKNTEYVLFSLARAKASHQGDEPFDEAKFVTDLAADDAQKGALGIASAPQARPAQTAPQQDGPEPPPNEDGTLRVKDMSAEAWNQRKKELGIIN